MYMRLEIKNVILAIINFKTNRNGKYLSKNK